MRWPGTLIDRALIGGGTTVRGSRLSTARIPGADEGTAINRVYGTARIGGTMIWATRFEEEVTSERTGGKSSSGPRVETFRYFANFAVGLCEGPVASVRRVWADGKELDLTKIEMRFYPGDGEQLPDPLIEAKQGAGLAPAYRGLAYVVFERLPLDNYGNRIPLLQFEVVRPIGRLEEQIKAICITPGATEHGYRTVAVSEKTGAGSARVINRNSLQGLTDWTVSIDELMAVCPNLERVALVVSWFGTDLRAGNCRIVPGVEVRSRNDESSPWSVSGISRAEAHLVSRLDGGPAYGGTPDDASVIAAIADLKARGLKVFLYPFVMMDIAEGNSLPDPYGGVGQAAYPWRGRMTCHPAIGQSGTADRTSAARSQIAAFCGSAQAGHFSVSGQRVTLQRQRGELPAVRSALCAARQGGRRHRGLHHRLGDARADAGARRNRGISLRERAFGTGRGCEGTSAVDEAHLCGRLERVFRLSPAGWQRGCLFQSRSSLGVECDRCGRYRQLHAAFRLARRRSGGKPIPTGCGRRMTLPG